MIPRRSRRWAIFALATGLLLSGALFGSVILRARRLLQEHNRESDQILDEFRSEACVRPAILEPEENGNAWELEVRALTAVWVWSGTLEDAKHRYNRHTGLGLGMGDLEFTMPADGRTQAGPWVGLLLRALRMKEVTPRKHPGTGFSEAGKEATEILLHDSLILHRESRDFEGLERIVLSIGLAQDLARHGDREHLEVLWRAVELGAPCARQILSSHSLKAHELESLSRALDRLAASRPGIDGILRRDAALSRRYVIREFADMITYTSDEPALKPDWRDLGSETLCKVRRLNALKLMGEAFTEIERIPPWQRQEDANRILTSLNVASCPWEELPGERLFASDAVVLLHRTLLRVAVALAWYEAERGALPEKLEELVPRYIPAVPVCPVTGQPLRYEAGHVWSVVPRPAKPDESLYDALAAERFNWRVARKAK